MPLNPDQLEDDLFDMLGSLSGRSDNPVAVRREYAYKLRNIIHEYVLSATVTVNGTTTSACTAGGNVGACTAQGTLS